MNAHDDQHLRLLSIFHYVVAGLAAVFSLLPVFHLVIGLLVVGEAAAHGPEERFGLAIGWLFVAMATVMILGGLTFAALLAVAGRFLAQRRHYTYCMVMAAVSCIFVPVGTVLGVFTLIVLLRPSVQEVFEGAPQPEGAG